MKRVVFLLFTLWMAGSTCNASADWTIQGKSYKVDTLQHLQIGPGTTVTTLSLSGASSLRLHYTETDLTNPYVKVRATNGSTKVGGRETLSKQSAAYTTDDAIYFAGVNADFFNINKTDEPMGYMVVDGEFYTQGMSTGYQAVGFTDDNVPYLADVPMATFSLKGTTVKVNTTRGSNELILYTQRQGTTTGTTGSGVEVAVTLKDGTGVLRAGSDMELVVLEEPVSKSNHAIEEGQFVLSASGTTAAVLRDLKEGQTVTLKSSFVFDGVDASNITQCVGGRPLILKDGEVLNTEKSLDHLTQNNPRTAVGYNSDKTKLILLVVDGRKKNNSAGVVSKQLADIMANLGCSDAMNLDGGGSSELYTRDFGIINSPSDGNERQVTDAIFLVTNAPADNEVQKLYYTGTTQVVAQYSTFAPSLYGYNKYGVVISKDYKGAKLLCDEALGQPTADGTAILCTGVGDFTVKAVAGTDTVEIPVTVVEGELALNATTTFDDGYRGAAVSITSKAGGKSYAISPSAFAWSIDDETVASIDSEGLIRGVSDGETTAHVTIGEDDYDIGVTVQIPTQHRVALDPGFDSEAWTAKQSGALNQTLTSEDGVLSFSFTGSGTSMQSVSYTREVSIWSIPDTLQLVINPGNVTVNTVILTGRSALGKSLSGSVRQTLTQNEYNVVNIPITAWTSLDKRENFPLTFTGINLNTGKFEKDVDYNIRIRSLYAIYSAIEPDATGIRSTMLPKEAALVSNVVTNGFMKLSSAATGTTRYTFYSLSGQQLCSVQPAAGATTVNLPENLQQKGLYLVRATDGSEVKTSKVLVK